MAQDLTQWPRQCLSTTMTATRGGLVPTPPNDATKYLDGTGNFSVPQANRYPTFDVTDYGGKFDGVQLFDGAVSASSTAFSSATAVFTSADTGKYIIIHGAGASGISHITTMTYVSAHSVTLAVAASTTVTSADFYYVSDDTTAWQSAINSATAAAYTVDGAVAIVTFPNGISGIAGALQDTSVSNSQLYIPHSGYNVYAKVVIQFQGQQSPNPATSGSQTTNTTPAFGTILLGLLNAGTNASLFCCRATSSATQNNSRVQININNLTVRMPPNPVLTGIDLSLAGCCDLSNLTVDAGNQRTYSVSYKPILQPTHSGSYGIKTPLVGNNAYLRFGQNVMVCGFYNAITINEHFEGGAIIMSCINGLIIQESYHAILITKILFQGVVNGIVITGGSIINLATFKILLVNNELQNGTYFPSWFNFSCDLYDPSNLGYGELTWNSYWGGGADVTTYTKNGGANVRCTRLKTGVVS